jgi:phosphoribosyl 1,2-cyclic phosphate phosphodiesterase
MKVLLMGTGGADGIPALYGNDRVSKFARANGGKDLRTRSAALVDSALKLDLGPDTLSQVHRFGVDPTEWSAVFFTHSDEDHMCLSEIQYGMFPFVDAEKLEYTIYGNEIVCQLIRHRYPEWPIDLIELKKYETVIHEAYQVTPVSATHKGDEDCHNFIVERDGRRLLYATDTGFYHDEVFDFLAGKEIHALVVECSDGFHKTPYVGHMDIEQCVTLVGRLRESRALGPDAQVFTTHHAAGGGAIHSELEAALGPWGIHAGYDGLSFEV